MNNEDSTMASNTFSYNYADADDNTLTISVADTSIDTINLGDISISPTSWDDFTKTRKSSSVYDLDIDPFAAIIQIKRTGIFPDMDLIQRSIPNLEFVKLAQSIREYYLDKIITQKLSSRYIDTEFKKEMIKALKLTGKCVLESDHIRLLYRLDDFYAEDTFIDKLVDTYKTLPENRTIKLNGLLLEYVGSSNVFRRGSRNTHFYFKTSNDYLIRLRGPNNDWLMPITSIFKVAKNLKVSGTAVQTKINIENDFKIAELNNSYTIDEFII